jgi:hypothetical protein
VQAAWCRFQDEDEDEDASICVLHDSFLTVFAPSGEAHIVPLPERFAALWPLPQGVLLSVSSAHRDIICCASAAAVRFSWV